MERIVNCTVSPVASTRSSSVLRTLSTRTDFLTQPMQITQPLLSKLRRLAEDQPLKSVLLARFDSRAFLHVVGAKVAGNLGPGARVENPFGSLLRR